MLLNSLPFHFHHFCIFLFSDSCHILKRRVKKEKKCENDESGEAESLITHHYLILKMKTRNGEELARQEKERKIHLN